MGIQWEKMIQWTKTIEQTLGEKYIRIFVILFPQIWNYFKQTHFYLITEWKKKGKWQIVTRKDVQCH